MIGQKSELCHCLLAQTPGPKSNFKKQPMDPDSIPPNVIDLSNPNQWILYAFVGSICGILSLCLFLALVKPSWRRKPLQSFQPMPLIPALVIALIPTGVIMGGLWIDHYSRFYLIRWSDSLIELGYPTYSVQIDRSKVTRIQTTYAAQGEVDLVIRAGENRYRSVRFKRYRDDLQTVLSDLAGS